MIKRLLLLTAALAISCLGATDAAAAGDGIRITHQARSIQPGEVVLILAESEEPLQKVNVLAFGRTFSLFPGRSSRDWEGLIGIDLDAKPGRHTAEVRAVTKTGTTLTAHHILVVKSKAFPTRRLTVDPKFVTPPAREMGRIRTEARKVGNIFSSVSPERYWHGSFLLPVPGAPISGFGKRSILNGQPRSPHSGTDFRGANGTPIKAPNSGRVVLAENLYYSGNTVIIDHGLGLYSYLAHLSRISVEKGNDVERGQVVGEVGSTGRVTGPHLHWSVRLAGTRVDPLSLVAVCEELEP